LGGSSKRLFHTTTRTLLPGYVLLSIGIGILSGMVSFLFIFFFFCERYLFMAAIKSSAKDDSFS